MNKLPRVRGLMVYACLSVFGNVLLTTGTLQLSRFKLPTDMELPKTATVAINLLPSIAHLPSYLNMYAVWRFDKKGPCRRCRPGENKIQGFKLPQSWNKFAASPPMWKEWNMATAFNPPSFPLTHTPLQFVGSLCNLPQPLKKSIRRLQR